VDLCGLPGSVSANSLALIGLANIVGGLAAGWLCQRYRMKWLLFGMYASRAVMVGLYLVAPKTDLTFYLFAFGLGLTWLATVPPTAGLVGKLFGLRYLGTLFGLTLLSHQIGAFWRLAGRPGAGRVRQLRQHVDRRHRAGQPGRADQRADPRGLAGCQATACAAR
jgi:hypothetical protein